MNVARQRSVRNLVVLALTEDLDRGDVTTDATLDKPEESRRGSIVARSNLVVCGLEVAALVFRKVDDRLAARALVRDGEAVKAGTEVMRIEGPVGALLAAERTALNFLMRMSGVATLTRAYVEAIAGTGARIVDTRKTLPGFRALDKAAVRAGGGSNHRADLGSGILIKDNHIAACGSVRKAVERALERAPHSLRVEVEVDTLEQLDEAIAAGAHLVLLDNMTPEQVRKAAARAKPKGIKLEVSGGLRLESVREYAAAGADLLSVGALTHSAPAVDLALDLA